jgi:hypothetical protein
MQPASFLREILRQGTSSLLDVHDHLLRGAHDARDLLRLIWIGMNIGFGGFISFVIFAPILAAVGLFNKGWDIHLSIMLIGG